LRARDNPFAVERLHALRFRGPTATELWTRALTHGGRGALVGAEGAGKTTLLLELAAHLRGLCYRTIWIQLRRDARGLTAEHRGALTSLGARDVVFVDGADLLSYRDRGWLVRRAAAAAGVLGTLHAPGWLPTVAALSTTPALLDELVLDLTGRAMEPGDRDALFARHRGNVRTALFELYDRAATRTLSATFR
jgi:hypothetical protein